jgi:hypothetical protein
MARPWQPLGRRPTRTGSLRPNRPSLRYLESISLPWLARCRFGILQFNHGTMSERVCANELPAPNQYPLLVPWGRAAALPGSGRISSSHAWLSPPPFCSTPVWQLDSGHGFHLKQSPHHHEHCRRYQQAATRQFWSYVAMVCQRAVVTKLVRCQWNLQRLRTRDDAETLAPWNSGCLFSSCVNSAILIALVSLMHGLPLLTEECGCTFAIPDLVQLPQGLGPIVSSSRRT